MTAPLCCRFAFTFAAAAGASVFAQGMAAHHGPDGFRNNYPHEAHQSFWLWKWAQIRNGTPQPPLRAAVVHEDPPRRRA